MDETQARDLLAAKLQCEEEPTLTPMEVDNLLEMARRADSAGLAPTEDEWEPTWDLDAAAAEGWRWKAGKAAPRYGVTLGTESLQRQQMYAHCVSQADRYARRSLGSIGVKSAHAD